MLNSIDQKLKMSQDLKDDDVYVVYLSNLQSLSLAMRDKDTLTAASLFTGKIAEVIQLTINNAGAHKAALEAAYPFLRDLPKY